MDQLSIKIRIADREYPMKVKPEDEENVRKAGKIINERIKSYREQFGIDDKQDLLAMVAFDSLVDKLQVDNENATISEDVFYKVNELNELISKAL
ncbi:MAG: cell division protein ZapA [Cyclobacteriaceae bacterium]|nr:cell division protein ZapA [Cyclobacteriaceae bacterium]